jgi:catechol 2,3-dioxygenase
MTNVDAIRPRALDLQDLLATVSDVGRVPTRSADGLRVGHLHLHVGGIDAARTFWIDVVGFEQIAAMSNAAFVSAGGYHHHLAFNTWRGDGVPPAPANGVVGLVHWTVELPSIEELDALEARLRSAARTDLERVSADLLELQDPWGMVLRVGVASTPAA